MRLPDLHPDDTEYRIDLMCRLVGARADAELLQQHLGAALGITASAVSRFERGTNPTLAGVQAYARACGLRVDLHFDALPDVDSYEADGLLLLADEAAAAGKPARAESFERAAAMARFTAIRRHLNLTCRDVAERLGCSPRAVGQLEQDRDLIQLSSLQKLVRALGGCLRVELVAAGAAPRTAPLVRGPAAAA